MYRECDLYLAHHGVKGQKWGVRRYQNKDGTLTKAGKEKYYQTDSYGRSQLTKAGATVNASNRAKAETYKNSTLSNLKKVDSSFESNTKKYLAYKKANNEHYLNERNKWLNQEGDYKGKDYYQFKDISADKWFATKESKYERAAYNSIRKSVEKAAKEHPLYSKSFKQLKETYMEKFESTYIKEVNYGDYVVNGIMRDIESEAIRNQNN